MYKTLSTAIILALIVLSKVHITTLGPIFQASIGLVLSLLLGVTLIKAVKQYLDLE